VQARVKSEIGVGNDGESGNENLGNGSAVGVRTFHLTVAYEGTKFSGWQVQPGRRTVQGELERVVAKFAGHELRIMASGRTDAGVHAIGQVARCVLQNWRADEESLGRAINSRLPDDMIVTDVRETHNGFHPIADAIVKQYRYQLQIGGNRDPFSCRTWHRIQDNVDTDLLNLGAEKLIGRHDFAAFQAAGAKRASTVRTITSSRWRCVIDSSSNSRSDLNDGDHRAAGPRSTHRKADTNPIGSGSQIRSGKPAGVISPVMLPLCEAGSRWVYEVEGTGFLYNMVRNLVGTMLDVARGHQSLDWIDEVIASKDRRCAGPTAPPTGLFLWRVDYPDGVFLSS